MKEKILIVEDESEYLYLVCTWLRNAGFEAITAADGVEGMHRVYSCRPDLVILDVNIPKMDGWEVCRRIRDMSDIPVLMVTCNGNKADRLKGFTLGADDYLTKPVDFHEMIARIQAILRRSGAGTQEDKPSTFRNGEIEIDWKSRQVWVRGERVKLSPTEFKIMSCLIKNRGWIVTHEQLLEKAWGPDYIADKSSVKLYIRYLRQKIEQNPHKPQIIITERGVGYCIAMKNEEGSTLGG
jgi:DNA-binding response OmpR family regulator